MNSVNSTGAEQRSENLSCTGLKEQQMVSLKLILMILAVVILALATVNVNSPRVNLLGLGLTLWALSLIIPA